MYGSDYLLGLSTFAPELFGNVINTGRPATLAFMISMINSSTWVPSPSAPRCLRTSTRLPSSCISSAASIPTSPTARARHGLIRISRF